MVDSGSRCNCRQLGLEPETYARQLIDREGGADQCIKPLTPDTDMQGDYLGQGNNNEFGQRYATMLKEISSAALSAIPAQYDRAATLSLPGGVMTQGHHAADQFWMGLHASLPDAELKIHHCIGREDPLHAPRAAVRWSLQGTHSGWGMFGKPSGATVYVLGISHAEYGPRGLRREWVLFDETAIWKQIVLQTG